MKSSSKYILILILIVFYTSCKNETNNASLNGYDKFDEIEDEKILTRSEYNADLKGIQNIERPKGTIIRNLEIDTTKFFGIWTQDPSGPHADFWLTSKSFFVVDYDGNGKMPYILDKDKITIFYNDFIQTGIIQSVETDTLKIRWAGMEQESLYVKFEN